MADKKDNVTDLPTVPPEDVPPEAQDALKKSGQSRLVGYILSPESMAELIDQCENIPGRYYKRMAPCLMNASQLVETEDGKFNVVNPNSG